MAELDLQPRRDDNRSEGGSGTVAKALGVLEAIAEAPVPLRFGDLLKSQPYPKATLHRLIKTLIQNGMVAYDARRQTYHLGLRLIRLASGAWTRSTLAEAARATLDGLSSEIGETLHLAMLDSAQVLYVDKRTTDRSVAMFSSTGKVGPAYCTGVGKAMLAYLSPEQMERAIDRQSFHAFTDSTYTTPAALKAELQQIRSRGFAYDREEHEPNIICIAVPVLSERDGLLGGLSVTGTTFSSSLAKLETYAPRLKEAARQIAAEAAVRMMPGT
ncbi:MAG: IclR family transcriptional regulator [Kiloniellales bacterium]|nr:IclR family transcriptional regulator [Kiloniellales bacterium]